MKTFIKYDERGNEVGYCQATSHNKAELLAKAMHGSNASVAYTEISAELEQKLFGKRKTK